MSAALIGLMLGVLALTALLCLLAVPLAILYWLARGAAALFRAMRDAR